MWTAVAVYLLVVTVETDCLTVALEVLLRSMLLPSTLLPLLEGQPDRSRLMWNFKTYDVSLTV